MWSLQGFKTVFLTTVQCKCLLKDNLNVAGFKCTNKHLYLNSRNRRAAEGGNFVRVDKKVVKIVHKICTLHVNSTPHQQH